METNEEIESLIDTAKHEDVKKSSAPAKPPAEAINRHFEETDPEWEFYLEWVAEAAPLSSRSFTTYLRTRPAIGGPIEDMTPQTYGLDSRWTLLFVVCKNHIHSGQFEQALEILEKYVNEFVLVDEEFKSRPMYLHLKSEILKNIGDEDSIKESYQLAISANSAVKNHSGIKNIIGEIITVALSENISLTDLHQLASSKDDMIQVGISHIENAIDSNPEISTYHATFGRLLAHNEEFKKARTELNEAIRLENPDRVRYNTRVSRYQRFLSQVELQHQEQELTELSDSLDDLEDSIQESQSEIEDLQNKSESRYQKLEDKYNDVLRDFQSRNLQFIGFFAALIAVIIAIVDISISMPYPEAAGLILVLIGGVLLAFAGLQNVLPSAEDENTVFKKDVIANATVGIILIAVGLLIPSELPV